ncbi:MAG TPA: AbrB/MazE/SpoVT family DNA-binding domain-containing protein [Candidatus Nanoarchaeia archaeon]|nr:AbrB/MazE/SpoVT family DNA-binding domain-containing protein [Candidatus Nanoarchaeia archaeon]
MIEVVNLSSKGQLVIPKNMREEMRLNQKDKFVMVNDKDTILLKRLQEEEMKTRMQSLMKEFTAEFKKKGITTKELAAEIKAARKAR